MSPIGADGHVLWPRNAAELVLIAELALFTFAVQIKIVMQRYEVLGPSDPKKGIIDRDFDGMAQFDVFDKATANTNQMMMMADQAFGEFESGVV